MLSVQEHEIPAWPKKKKIKKITVKSVKCSCVYMFTVGHRHWWSDSWFDKWCLAATAG